MAGVALLLAGLATLVFAARIGGRAARGATQGVAVLVVVIGVLLLLRRPGSGLHLPGHGPRRWHQP
ncbi:hypothetical protein DFH01_11745 [Falsiroseomonas bella]|uniref:Uncharacterized protein n=1 Tax=Falsiroseomonas bella TaxID=2184016 RepID=A0A317FFD3_9PROT|nr:hypothetical protein [Falsiroseomonas bella]PWS37495.1 hypothetical protein DFH01_11745 [Falsiroseomonas bella]